MLQVCRRGVPDPGRLSLLLWLVAGAAGAGLLSGVWRWSWLAAAVLSGLLLLPGPRLRSVRLWLYVLARQFALVGGCLLLMTPLWTRAHAIPGSAHALLPLVRLFGAEAAVEGHALRLAGYPQAGDVAISLSISPWTSRFSPFSRCWPAALRRVCWHGSCWPACSGYQRGSLC